MTSTITPSVYARSADTSGSGGTMETGMAPFQGNEIRKTLHDNEWWFSVVDVCAALTDCANTEGICRIV